MPVMVWQSLPWQSVMKKNSIISLFMRHKVAANLLMALMFVCGFWALTKLNVQFLPSFNVDIISINIAWPGASAEDVEQSITIPIEQELKDIEYLKEMKSNSQQSMSSITLEFDKHADMGEMLENVRERVGQVGNLPEESETPKIKHETNYEVIAKLLISSDYSLEELRPVAKQIERELLSRGIAKITINGLPEMEMAIQVPSAKLLELNHSLTQIANTINNQSQDFPAGEYGRQIQTQQLRSLEQKRSIESFHQLAITKNQQGEPIQLGDIAKIKLRQRAKQALIKHHDKPAVEMVLYRSEHSNALTAAKALHRWLDTETYKYAGGIHIQAFDESWIYIKDRINLLVHNGIGGLILILIILFAFLNSRIALWIAIGIPTSLFAALAFLYLFGSSINMISLFAMIMTLGIIVDDTIVVGEEALTQIQKGNALDDAVATGASTMLEPIASSSLTTISAFLPLMLIGDIIGKILFDIPLVVICVIIASLIECFLVLPGHLFHALKKPEHPWLRYCNQAVNKKFNAFKEGMFRATLTKAIQHRRSTIITAVCLLAFSINLVLSQHVPFTFFPTIDASIINAKIEFTSDTPKATVEQYVQHVENALHKTVAHYSDETHDLVKTQLNYYGMTTSRHSGGKQADNIAQITVELPQADHRTVNNNEFIRYWRSQISLMPGVENLSISAPKSGPPGKDIDIELSGNTAQQLKKAAVELTNKIQTYTGVNNVKDDLPFGQEHLIFKLTPQGQVLGLTTSEIGRQLRAAFHGAIAQMYYDDGDEIDVTVTLPDEERNDPNIFDYFPVTTPLGTTVPLANVASFKNKQGLDLLRHTDGLLSVHVTGEVNAAVTNANQILKQLQKTYLPDFASRNNVHYSLKGRATEQRDTMQDMRYGLYVAMTLIYIILAWVFASYAWPIVIMLAIPFGLVGAIIGHWLMGINLTILSLFGIFGLTGIVINDAIILICRYKEIKPNYGHPEEAIIEASIQRLRPVMLTSLTTIAGLTPLLFETSLQAQFLIPMAASIAFGLGFATLLILFVIPAMLLVYEHKIHLQNNNPTQAVTV